MPCRIIKLKDKNDPALLDLMRALHERGQNPDLNSDASPDKKVAEILAQVRQHGDQALLDYSRQFDCPTLALPLRVSEETLQLAAASIPAEDMDIIIAAAANIREFHSRQKQQSWFMTNADGAILGQKVDAVDRAGLYVPGGQGGNTPLISSLLMGAIPAQVAGVSEIAVVTPPRQDGSLNAHLLAAAYMLELTEVFRVGGPWAIGALAYGTESIKPVDVIAGPGNIFVTTAKKQVRDKVGIDMLAGPSEILIIADDSATVDWLSADLLAQAEHDALASAVCLTDSPHLADRLRLALELRLKDLPRAEIARKALADWGALILLPNLELAVDIANALAPEHLEICTRDPWALMPQIRKAGAIFMGHHTPESLGDYFAGPNHVLPTNGTARFSSALGVDTFTRKTSLIASTQTFSRNSAEAVARLARLEGLEAHAQAAQLRAPHFFTPKR